MQDKEVYGYDGVTGEYYGPEIARVCPVTRASYIYPSYTTETAPPAPLEGKAIVWTGSEWGYAEDHRGKMLYDPETRAEFGVMLDLGPIPENLVLELPPLPEPLTIAEN